MGCLWSSLSSDRHPVAHKELLAVNKQLLDSNSVNQVRRVGEAGISTPASFHSISFLASGSLVFFEAVELSLIHI